MSSDIPVPVALRRAFARAAVCSSLAALLALCSCTVEEPEIAAIETRRLLIQNEAGGFSLALSVFALFSGGSAADDFAMMTVTHEATGIFWEIPAGSALLFPGGNEYFWAGSSSLLPIPSMFADSPANSPIWGAEGFFPNGSYTVTADNAAGSSATSSFALDAPFYFSAQPAVFRLSGEGQDARWSVVLSENLNPRDVSVYLFLLDAESNPLSSIRIAYERFRGRRAEGRVSDFAQALSSRREGDSAIAAACCYIEHAASSSAVLLSPLSLGHEQ